MSFPIITKTIQASYEKLTEGKEDKTPMLCGYYGRACRHMDDPKGACTMLCMGCPLAELAERTAKNGSTPAIKPGDVCVYSFGDENSSVAVVEVVKVLDDPRGIAEIKFRKVIKDDTGDGFFTYLQKSGGTMNASFKYLTEKGHWQFSVVEDDEEMAPQVAGYWCSICGGSVDHDGKHLKTCPHCGSPMA